MPRARMGARARDRMGDAIEESGDGPAQLVHGGSGGIRLQALATEPVSAQELDWSAETRSWAEPFLVITPMARCR